MVKNSKKPDKPSKKPQEAPKHVEGTGNYGKAKRVQQRDSKGRFKAYDKSPVQRAENNRYAIICEVTFDSNGHKVKRHISVVKGGTKLTNSDIKMVKERAGQDYSAKNVKVKPVTTIDNLYGVRVAPRTGEPRP